MNVIPMLRTFKQFPALTAVVCAAVLSAAVLGYPGVRSEWASAAVMFLFALLLLYDAFRAALKDPPCSFVFSAATAWSLLAAGCLLLIVRISAHSLFERYLVYWMFLLSAVCFFRTPKTALRMALPFAVCTIVMPLREWFMLLIGCPLRMGATVLSGSVMRLFGAVEEMDATTIRFAGTDIAITDACSGIQQMEAMLLIAWWLVRSEKKALPWRIAHFLFLMPAVLIANAFRLVLTMILFRFVGEDVLIGTWHSGFGYFQVLLTILIFYGAGFLLPENETEGRPCANS